VPGHRQRPPLVLPRNPLAPCSIDPPPGVAAQAGDAELGGWQTGHSVYPAYRPGVFVIDRNTPPVAVLAKATLSAKVGDTVSFDGSGSHDPDSFPGGTLSFRWNEICGPAAVSFANPRSDKPSFVAATAGAYAFELVVNDGLADSSHVRETVTVVAK
jgi:hypothetical protein